MTVSPSAAAGFRGRGPIPSAVLAGLPIVCAVAMEAAWISVLAGLVQEFALRHPVLNLAWMGLFVAVGVIAARVVAERAPARWPALGLILVVGGGVTGVLLGPEARSALATGHPVAALAANPGGILAGVAVLRGFPHGAPHLAFGTIARAVFVGIPGLGFSAALGGMIADPWRAEFLTDAAVAAGLFVAAGMAALAFAGLAEVERSGAPAWRGNPVWLGTLFLAVAGLLAIVVPASALGGPAIATVLQVVLGVTLVPLAIVGLLSGAGVGLRRTLLYVGGAAFVIWLLSLAPADSTADGLATGAGGAGSAGESIIDRLGVVGLGGAALVLIVAGVLLLVRAWMRRAPVLETGDSADVRSFDIPEEDLWRPAGRRRRKWRFSQPKTAPEAYVALVAELSGRPGVRRDPAETPSEHARRLREAEGASGAGLQLDLLAADFALGTYGSVPLSAAETRRAIARWRILRRRLGRGEPIIAEPPPPD